MWTISRILNKFPAWCAWFLIILDFIWELPQNIIGAVIKLIYAEYGLRGVETYKQGMCTINNWPMTSGISLGWFQFTNESASKDTASHEVGHSIQSVILGPLYLLVIGLPSIIWAGIIYPRVGGDYYRFYTETWANKLSGVYGG